MNRITRDRLPVWLAAFIVCAAYFLGAKLGFALKLHPYPISTMWPPNSILLAALLLAPTRYWGILLLAALPAHVAIQLANGVPVPMLLGWFVSNCSEALIGAALVRRLTSGPLRFDDSRHVGAFVIASFVGVTLSCFLDAGFVTLVGWGEGTYWGLWTARFFSNLLAELTLVPMIIAWVRIDREALRRLTPRRLAELGALMIALLAVSIPVFNWQKTGPERIAALLYAPLPFLVWAAVRFGARGTSTATLTVALLAIWGAMHQLGPFVGSVPRDNAMSIQLFLIFISVPLMLLSAFVQERRQAEREAILNEESLKLALDAAQMSIWDWSIIGSDATWPRETSRVPFGLILRVVHPDDRALVAEAVTAAIEKGTAWDVEFRIANLDGSVRWVMGKGEVLRDEAGRPVRLLGVNVDITDRKRADEALRASEELFAKAFRGSPDAMVISRQSDGRIIDVNAHWETLFGIDRGLAVERMLGEFLLGARASDQATLRRLADAPGPVREVELRLRTLTGDHRDAVLATEAIEMGGHACFVTTIRDVTDRRRAEREAQEQRELLTHLSRVAVLGELSGALAHELSQPLTSILSNAQAARRLLAREPVDLDEIREIVEDIVDDDRRAGEVIRRLRAMFKRGESNRQLLDLNELAGEVLGFAHSDLLNRHVQVTTRLSADLPKVRGDNIQLQQVLLNLIVNACEAMTGNEPYDRSLVIETAAIDHDTVSISVLDTGSGIPVDVVDQLFEPFVTTKQQGLGLGLTICRSIAVAHGGHLWAGNNADRGSAFRLVLPRDGSPASVA
jgi:PAS domain S-box-containing protein